MLAEARTAQDFRDVASIAAAARAWARARGLGIEAENQATEMVLRAERGLGKMVLDLIEDGAIYSGQDRVAVRHERIPRADVVGDMTPVMYNAIKDLARIPDERFEQMLAEARAKDERIAKRNFYQDYRRSLNDGLRGIQNLPSEDAPDPYVAAFLKASRALIAQIERVPLADLPEIAQAIKALANAYNAERSRRA